eukprot:Protomagalhaensia_wolfi_Nauph_80__3559@NODE_3602_length_756_cov_5_542538_g2833_i0_p1_GENE_NODE_3602_length_756_cov_5_542538_g2833_i0NODE_3602_length_756_cov_5_542538_g2833_i0_p1_ORF_typecomplete_len135_score8_99PAC3/PF10178_9/0_067_NODE_3602_length_756_cov_5_542538_g2833_i0276680
MTAIPGACRQLHSTLQGSSESVEVSLLLFHDHILAKFGQNGGWGAVIQCDYEDGELGDPTTKIMIGDRRNLELQLWARELSVPLHRLGKRHVILSLDLPKDHIENLEELKILVNAFEEDLKSVPTSTWYKPSDF